MYFLSGQAEQKELCKQLRQSKERAEHLEADLIQLQKEFESARQAHSAAESLKRSLEESERVNGTLHESLRTLTEEVRCRFDVCSRASRCSTFDGILRALYT